ncbi:MAG: fumarylacetoacetate hydrolase family protein [Pirellulaceae bacterium]|nr:fumarylacetoacetate hydrolase family protein [Pirellulaceae bacterium]
MRRIIFCAAEIVCGLSITHLTVAAQPTQYARFQHGNLVAYGLVVGDQVQQIDGDLFGDFRLTDQRFALDQVHLLPPTQPSQILALAGNYRSHLNAEEIPPKFQVVQPFYKSPSCVVGQGQNIVLPADSSDVHFEAELVIVIGKRCSRVSEAEAMDYVFGVTAGNDVSERFWQNDPQHKDIQWWRAKGADTFGPVGPVIATGIDYGNLRLQMKVNGQIKQDDRTSSLIHSIPKTVSYISQYVTLQPGDLIFTGTPGETSPIQPGDVCEVELEGVGTLRNPVIAQPANGMMQMHEQPGEYLDILAGDRPVVRFMLKPRDGSSPEAHYETFKPFHHVFDPLTGTQLLTGGAHPNTKQFLYPHHRGLFFGFNRIAYGGQQADIWHGKDGVHSTCLRLEDMSTSENSATHTAVIGWFGTDGQQFAEERRTVVVYNSVGGTQIDWSTELTTKLEKVRLDGDPQHAGFHFRAHQDVAMHNSQQTYYLRPDGRGKLGETRNWDAKRPDPITENLPWNAMSFVVSDQRYTVLRINHPDNPGPTRGSERDYGRFGDYFEYDLTPDKPLRLKYRLWIQAGEMQPSQCAQRATWR